MSDTLKINGIVFDDVEYIKAPKYIEPTEEVPNPEPEYAYYRHTRNLTSPINIAEVFAGTATEINDFNGEINGVLSAMVTNGFTSLQSLILPAVTSTSGETCRNCTGLRYVRLDSCVSTSTNSFRGCSSLEEIHLPVATSLANDTFEQCPSLITCDVPLVQSVGQYCFYGCTSLKTLSLPRCTILSHQTFYNCSNLETLNIPEVTTIYGSDVFYNCAKLLNFTFEKVVSFNDDYTFRGSRFEEAVFPAYTGAIRYRAFRDASAVKSVRFPLATGADSQAFYNATSLKSAYIQKATWIGGTETFYNCSAMEKLVLGNYFCTLGNTNVFNNSSIARSTGYVYVGLYFLDKIRNASNWATYASRILPFEMLEDSTLVLYSVSVTLPANCKPRIRFRTSKCDVYSGGSKIVVGDSTDTLQYDVECVGFVSVSGSIAITDANTSISLDLSGMQADVNFNGFSIVYLDFINLPANRSNYASLSTNGFSQYGYENYYDKGGIYDFSNNNYLTANITLPNYSGMTNPVFLWETITDIVDGAGCNYSMGGSNSSGGQLWVAKTGITHYASGSRINVSVDLGGIHHVAMAITSTTVYLYIDGELQGTYSDSYLINGMRYTTPRIGNNQSDAGSYIRGKIRNLAVTVRDIADPSVYENCGFVLDGLVPQEDVI